MFGTPEERDAFDRHQTRGAVSLFVETKWNFRRKQHTLSFGKPPTQHRAFARVLPSRQSYVDQTKRVLFVDVWCASFICGNHMCFLLVCMYVCVCATKINIQLSSVCVCEPEEASVTCPSTGTSEPDKPSVLTVRAQRMHRENDTIREETI